MKNQYVGDVGDFYKYGMLRYLSKTALKLGINWYLTEDDLSNDGNKITYLSDNNFRICDPELFSKLYQIVNGQNKSIRSIEEANLFSPEALYFSEPLIIPQDKSYKDKVSIRNNWHKQAINALSTADIIFLDPDNEIEIKSKSLTSIKGNKYVGLNELRDYLLKGKSCIVYNHRRHASEEDAFNIYKSIIDRSELESMSMIILTYRKGGTRDFVFLIQPQHAIELINCCDELIHSTWRNHFSYSYIIDNSQTND